MAHQHQITILIKNPGIPYENIMVQEAEKRGIPVWTEIELAYYLTSAKFIGIPDRTVKRPRQR